ncbi:MAG: hypothetical protein HYZ50_09625 [Deltaproteobacteria bacterium]|nr:hypothetical protein [Deltaproteobacteria bacterium]
MTALDIERLKEQIKFETEVLKFTALVMIGLGGGSISLGLGEHTPLRLALVGLGFLSTLLLGIVSWRVYKRVGALIAQMKEDSV